MIGNWLMKQILMVTKMKVSKDRYITNIDVPIGDVEKIRLLYGKKKRPFRNGRRN